MAMLDMDANRVSGCSVTKPKPCLSSEMRRSPEKVFDPPSIIVSLHSLLTAVT
jgi:hypothetical protein